MSNNNFRIAKNYFYNLTYHVFILLTPLVTTPYISRVLGAANIGIYSFTDSVKVYFSTMGSLGFALYGQREIARCGDSIEERSQIFYEIFTGRAALTGLSLLVYALCTCFVFKDNQTIFAAQMLGFVASQINTDWLFQGLEEFRLTVLRSYIVKLLTIVCLFVFVKTPDDLFIYTVIMNLSNVFGNALLLTGIRKYVRRPVRLSIKKLLRHLKPAFILGIPFYANSIYWVIDKTLLTALSGQYAEVGYYEQTEKIVTFAMGLVTSLGTVFLPRLVQETEHDAKDNVRKYMQHGLVFVVLLGMPIMMGLIVMSSSIVPWFFGAGYEKVVGLLRILAPLALVMGLSSFVGNQYLVASGRERMLAATIILGVGLNILFDALLIPRYASYGAAMATLISEIIKLIIQMYAARKMVPFKKIGAGMVTYGVFSLVMSAVVMTLERVFFADDTMVNSLVLIAVGVCTYFLFLLISKNYYLYKVFSYVRDKIAARKA